LLDKVIAISLMIVVVFSALAHGVVEPWSIFIFELLAAVLVLLWMIKTVTDKYFSMVIPQTIWPLVVLILLGLAQSVSWRNTAGVRQSLSFDVDSTRGTMMVLCSLLALSMLAANFLIGARRLSVLTNFLILFGAVMGVFGLVQHFSGSTSVYWLRQQTNASVFGPFFNRDHFAGYMELFIALPVAVIVTRYACGERRMVYGIAAMFMGIAAVFTLSRGGMISILAELIFLAAMSLRYYRSTTDGDEPVKSRMVGITVVVIILSAIVLGVIWMGAEPVINRIATGDPNNSDLSKAQPFYGIRGEIWENTWTMIRHNPLMGVGLGAYETAYPIYARESGVLGVTAEAHNDYLQILADAGLMGAAVALWFIIILLRAIARGVRSPDPLMAAIALGGGAGLFGLLVHSLFDFNLHLPSHALVFLILSNLISYLGETVDEPSPSPIQLGTKSIPIAPDLIREVSS
jgi:O-antigen ligase